MAEDKPLRIVQVSDSHLSGRAAWFLDNWDIFVNEMRAAPPDLIVWTGDVSLSGADGEEDLEFARREMERLPCRTLVLAGNHDIGEPSGLGNGEFPNPKRERPITESRRRRWRKHFGPEWWSEDFGAWRLYGLNAQLFGSGLEAEKRQCDFFVDALEDADRRPGLLFIHKPLFYADPAEREPRLYCVFPEARHWILQRARDFNIKVIGSGHLHCYRSIRHAGIRMVWAPGTAFINTLKKKDRPAIRVTRRVGYVEYHIDGRRIASRLVEPDLFVGHDIRNWAKAHGTTVNLPPRRPARLGREIR
jgi:3',5'-cyclic AMP phosphodiesterase CpdA